MALRFWKKFREWNLFDNRVDGCGRKAGAVARWLVLFIASLVDGEVEMEELLKYHALCIAKGTVCMQAAQQTSSWTRTWDGTRNHSPQFGWSVACKHSVLVVSGDASTRAHGTKAKSLGLNELKCSDLAIMGHSRCCGSKAITRQPSARESKEK